MGAIFKKLRIGDLKNQMKLLTFYFGLNLSHHLYAVTDNASKTLQQEEMSALRGRSLLTLLFKHWKTRGMSMILACYTKNKSIGWCNRGNITTSTSKKAKNTQLFNTTLRYRKLRGNSGSALSGKSV